MKSEIWRNKNQFVGGGGQVVEVLAGMKSLALIIDLESDSGDGALGLYRPEKGIRLSVDPRVPKPSELYRDVVYYHFCNFLGWDGVLPVILWQLDADDKGVIRPFLREAQKMEIYHFDRRKMDGSDSMFWRRIALADYIFEVGDRVSNDFLIFENDVYVVDSGFSFLEGVDFCYQQSVVRDLYKGDRVDESLLGDLQRLASRIEVSASENCLGKNELYWVGERVNRVLSDKRFL